MSDGGVLLATCPSHPAGEPGHEALEAAFEAQGASCASHVWDDPDVDWTAAAAVVVRCACDHARRRPDVAAWARGLGPALVPGAALLHWGTDRHRLLDLADRGLDVVPTTPVADPVALRGALADLDPATAAVVKTRFDGCGGGVVRIDDPRRQRPADPGPWLVQPLLPAVHEDGVVSVVVLGGHPVSQIVRLALPGALSAGEEYGGSTAVVVPTDEAALLAVRAVTAATELVGAAVVQARVDLLRHHGELRVLDIDVVAPRLFLDLAPGVAGLLADAVLTRL